MTFTALQVEGRVQAWAESDDYDGWGNPWGTIFGESTNHIPGLGDVIKVAAEGGEGEGDSAWVVFKIGDQLFMKTGYYASYDGFYWDDGDVFEVEAYQKTVTDYRPK